MMSTSTSEVYVWIHLPGADEPVPAGLLRRRGDGVSFSFLYGRRYLERTDAISLSPQLPLSREEFPPQQNLLLPGVIRDAAPDAWGRRVINDLIAGDPESDQDETTYLLRSESDRLGALDFQESPLTFRPRLQKADLGDLQEAADRVASGEALPEHLAKILLHGTAIGGARPKAVIQMGGEQFIAKFSSSTDTFNAVGAEAAATMLARHAGIDAPEVTVEVSLDRDVLLSRRFDRPAGGGRRMVVSAMTMLDLREGYLPTGSYPQLVDTLRRYGAPDAVAGVGEQVFRRIAFNIAISNHDDHARNHAAFWDGRHLALTPAYDLAPNARTGSEAAQIMAIDRAGNRRSTYATLIDAAHHYGLSRDRARELTEEITAAITDNWEDAADRARLTEADRRFLWGRQFLHPGIGY
jgi:serine/threonine-protein kinase HipA